MRCLHRILGITWQEKVINTIVLDRAKVPSMYSLLKQRHLRWLGHVVRMEDDRIPKDLLHGELSQETRPTGRPKLRYKDVCKRDLKALDIDVNTLEATASERPAWRQAVKEGLSRCEANPAQQSEAKRQKRKTSTQAPTTFVCSRCRTDCHSRIGLTSHIRRCQRARP